MAKEPLNEHDPAASQAPHDGIPAPTGDAKTANANTRERNLIIALDYAGTRPLPSGPRRSPINRS